MKYVPIEEFLILTEDIPVIDVRSEAEYLHAHIPGAHNIQLFNNEERAEIGLIYKLQGSENAISRGYELVGPKFAHYFDQLKHLTSQKKILLYCWRGGMRSSSLAWLYETAGYECYVLTKGYKAFRQHVLSSFSNPAKIIVLGGKTGTGKTDILKELAIKGEQVLDLEKYANHRGSAFGHLGQPPQPSSEFFENLLFMEWKNFDLSKPIWIEDESQQIGNIFIPKPLWLQMLQSRVLMLDMPFEMRVERLMQDYACFNTEHLINSFEKINRRIGLENLQKAVECMQNDDIKKACEIALKHYDKAYLNSLSKKNPALVHTISLSISNIPEISEMLVEELKLVPFCPIRVS
jgi:tRNA 2-selenouridine synthase